MCALEVPWGTLPGSNLTRRMLQCAEDVRWFKAIHDPLRKPRFQGLSTSALKPLPLSTRHDKASRALDRGLYRRLVGKWGAVDGRQLHLHPPSSPIHNPFIYTTYII